MAPTPRRCPGVAIMLLLVRRLALQFCTLIAPNVLLGLTLTHSCSGAGTAGITAAVRDISLPYLRLALTICSKA
jgi:hypothetical protein